jgi:hypothetical protein
MFADKNNHLIKQIFSGTKRRHGGELAKLQENDVPGNELEENDTKEEEGASLEKKNYDDIFPQYVFKNWSSQKINDEKKINVCAYMSHNNFVKYIVEIKDKKAFFPSFVFAPSQKGGFLDGESSDDPLDKSFEYAILKFANTFHSNSESVTGGDLTKVTASTASEEKQSQNDDEIDALSTENSEVMQSPNEDNEVMQSPSEDNEVMQSPNEDNEVMQSPTEVNEVMQSPSEDNEVMQSPSEDNEVMQSPSEDNEVMQSPSEDNEVMQSPSEDNEVMQSPPTSLNKDDSVLETTSSTSNYIGYLNINNNIYAFVKTTSNTSLKEEFTETILNELFHTFKVFDDDVDESVRTLFENNAWLLSKNEPFSGYLCDVDNEDKVIKNVKKTEHAELTNVESIGDFYYFSFLPLDKGNARMYQRYAFFPGEYVCILDESQLEEYKKDKMSFAEDKSIYFKGDILAEKKEGHEFFAIRTPSQFTQY